MVQRIQAILHSFPPRPIRATDKGFRCEARVPVLLFSSATRCAVARVVPLRFFDYRFNGPPFGRHGRRLLEVEEWSCLFFKAGISLGACIYMTDRFLRPIAHSGLVLTGLFLIGALSTSATRTSDDLDRDGYPATEVGGNDCVDSLQSVYRTNATACNPSAEPVFLESRDDPDTDDDIADHAWMQDNSGLFHLYFQTEDQGSGDFLEHYTSTDLTSLTYVGPALTQTAGGWDRYGLWAPQVVKNPADGLFYLFYAGVTAPGSNPSAEQRIGVATSSDLTSWIKLPINNCSGTTGDGCVYECNEPWTMWDNGGSYDAQCRDPFVIWDASNSRWLLFTTVELDTAVIGGPWTQGISVAQSADLRHWTGLGYIKATKRQWPSEGGVGAQLTGGVAENPFVTEYDGNYHLFFTDSYDPEDYAYVANPRTIVQYASSPTLDADPSGSLWWTYRGATRDPGVNATEILVVAGDTWLMTHSISGSPYSGYRETHFRDLRLKRISWNDDGTFTTFNLTALACRVPSADINPGAAEACSDGLDNNCSGAVDEPLCVGTCADADGDGYGTSGLLSCSTPQPDCNDANPNVHPAAPEICDSVDNDCDSLQDEGGVCRRSKIRWSVCEAAASDPPSSTSCSTL